MARTAPSPSLTANNRIYLYRLLSEEIGCGKQTLLPKVEDALASDRMTAEDLGFASTRELLEALESFIKLTVFKGGRIYATVIAQPEWDAALAAPASASANPGKSNKPWKRKKTDKSLKPIRPKRVKRPEPEPEIKSSAANDEAATAAAAAAAEGPNGTDPAGIESQSKVETGDLPIESAPATVAGETILPKEMDESSKLHGDTSRDNSTEPSSQTNEAVEQPTLPQPAISLTVVYDPYSGIDRETTIQSHPVTAPTAAPEPTPAAKSMAPSGPAAELGSTSKAEPECAIAVLSEPEPAPASAPKPATASESTAVFEPASATAPSAIDPVTPLEVQAPAVDAVSPDVLATYPRDLSDEVYLSSEVIAALCELLPYGTDVFTLLAKDWTRARELNLVSGTRARATFPLRIQHTSSIEPITVALKRRANSNLAWELASVE